MKTKNAERCRAYRARKILAGLCIAGCGDKSQTDMGLCLPCRDKYYARNNQRNHRLGKWKPWRPGGPGRPPGTRNE